MSVRLLMKLEEFVTQCAREAGLQIVNEREAHMYAQSVMPAGTADLDITPEEEPLFREAFLKILRHQMENREVLQKQIARKIAGN